MSFTNEVKKEITHSQLNECCKLASLCGAIQMYGRLSLFENNLGILMVCENASAVKHFKILFKEVLNLNSKQTMFKKTKLKQNVVYENLITEDPFAVYTKVGLYSESRGFLDNPLHFILAKDCCAKAYLGALFLARGSINRPQSTSYHLEMSFDLLSQAEFVLKQLKRFNIEGKIMKRRKQSVVYVKKADQIADFLKVLNTHTALYKFEDVRVQRDYLYNMNRVLNCDAYNYRKSQASAQKDLEIIERLLKKMHLNELDDKIREVVELRIKHPESGLKELCELYAQHYGKSISKSGLRHRFLKMKELAHE